MNSDLGVHSPEKYVFRQLLNMAAFVGQWLNRFNFKMSPVMIFANVIIISLLFLD